jgi:hypothetical protein
LGRAHGKIRFRFDVPAFLDWEDESTLDRISAGALMTHFS